jgi:hypothetical protein
VLIAAVAGVVVGVGATVAVWAWWPSDEDDLSLDELEQGLEAALCPGSTRCVGGVREVGGVLVADVFQGGGDCYRVQVDPDGWRDRGYVPDDTVRVVANC